MKATSYSYLCTASVPYPDRELHTPPTGQTRLWTHDASKTAEIQETNREKLREENGRAVNHVN